MKGFNMQRIWDKFWRDDQGRVVIWQSPNWPLIVWAIFTFLSLFFSGKVSHGLSYAGTAALIYWSYLEIFKGANYFRRLLGLLILAYSIITLIRGF